MALFEPSFGAWENKMSRAQIFLDSSLGFTFLVPPLTFIVFVLTVANVLSFSSRKLLLLCLVLPSVLFNHSGHDIGRPDRILFATHLSFIAADSTRIPTSTRKPTKGTESLSTTLSKSHRSSGACRHSACLKLPYKNSTFVISSDSDICSTCLSMTRILTRYHLRYNGFWEFLHWHSDSPAQP